MLFMVNFMEEKELKFYLKRHSNIGWFSEYQLYEKSPSIK